MGQIFVWTLSDVFCAIVGVLSFGMLLAIYSAAWWRQARCKHDGRVGETSACDAVCLRCGKNLGFIGNWREKQRGVGF